MKSERQEFVIQPKSSRENFMEEVLRLKGEYLIEQKVQS